jgi:hypothetical protein
MIRIALMPNAYRAIKVSLPEGSVVIDPERNERRQYLLALDEGTANSLSVKRRLGESMSDVSIRLAARGKL